jgi:hypothetical protein
MRRSGILRANDLQTMTGKELQSTLAEVGPCIESAHGTLVMREIQRRDSKRDRILAVLAIAATIAAGLISAVASQWDKFTRWLVHLF